jgi:hypothetical protein
MQKVQLVGSGIGDMGLIVNEVSRSLSDADLGLIDKQIVRVLDDAGIGQEGTFMTGRQKTDALHCGVRPEDLPECSPRDFSSAPTAFIGDTMILGTYGNNQWLPVRKATAPKDVLSGRSQLGQEDVRMSQTVATSYPKEPGDESAMTAYAAQYFKAADAQLPTTTVIPTAGGEPRLSELREDLMRPGGVDRLAARKGISRLAIFAEVLYEDDPELITAVLQQATADELERILAAFGQEPGVSNNLSFVRAALIARRAAEAEAGLPAGERFEPAKRPAGLYWALGGLGVLLLGGAAVILARSR